MPETVASFKFVPTCNAAQPLHFCPLVQKLTLSQVLHLVIFGLH